MDLVRFSTPGLLLLAPAAWAVVWLVAARSGRPGRWLRAGFASAAVALLAAALAEPSVRVGRRGVCPVVIAQDASPSMAYALAGTDPAALIAPWVAAFPSGRVEVVPFADGAETDVASGLRSAAAALPDGQGAVLLVTDARETAGDAVREAARLAAAGVPVHAVALGHTPRDVAVVAVELAPSPAPGRPLPVIVRLAATADDRADLRITRTGEGDPDGRTWQQDVVVSPQAGAIVQILDGPLPAGRYRYDVTVLAAGDVCTENDRARCTVTVGGYHDVAYVHAGDAPGPLAEALRRAAPPDYRVAARPVSAGPLPADASIVILENVSAWSLGRQGAARLARAVTDGGTGLLVLGGDATFAAGGYADSPLEALLPVSSRLGERRPLELVLVVDASGSMNETVGDTQKLLLAKRAILALRPALGAGDRIGVVAFAGKAEVVSPLVPLDEWDALRRRLLALQAGGGTRITPAIQAALDLLPTTPAPAGDAVRHVLVLSDGRSEDFDVSRLVAAARERSASLSAVATGADARGDLFGALARETGGRLYAGADLAHLAETFLADLARARGEGLRETPRDARWAARAPVWQSAPPPLAPVPAYNPTRPKDGADVHWVTAPGEGEPDAAPLLATWRRGLGKVAAMPWPAGDAAEDWLAGPAAVQRFRPLLAWLAPASPPRTWSARLVRRGSAWEVRVEESAEAIGTSAAPFTARLLDGGAAEPKTVTLEQVRPGVHEAATGPVGPAGGMVVVSRDGEADGVRLAAPALPPAEVLHLGVDGQRLEDIVRAGGGQVHASVATFREAIRWIETRGYRPVGLDLVWAAGAAVLALAALRLAGKA